MVDQRVDERAGGVAGAGMDDQPRRLVDDDELGILVEDMKRDVLALGSAGSGSGRLTSTARRP